ncbi:endo-1,4-beta-xylanase 3-like [Gigantopelta aegis]|uniref:endo-1,4-beta-xylanase 3-like n=1 Tax=Gigantopelta aegis TaxID=1735272 RepID=UPI001B88D42B|nr:endo-1,4-beta-xylanase 3-like [Gigantopelta aegis]
MWSLIVFLGLVSRGLSQEVLQNPDMESMTGWLCKGASCSLTGTSHGGNHAILTRQRTTFKRGPAQRIQVLLGKSYTVSAWVKLVNDEQGKLRQMVRITVLLKFKSAGIKFTEIKIDGPSTSVDFITDDVSMKPLAEWTNWLQDSNDNINQLRKSNLRVAVLPKWIAKGVLLFGSGSHPKIKQLKKSFPFGTAIGCDMYHHGDVNYQNFINDHFNWAVTENALKWNLMEQTQKLKQKGIKARGHNILWATDNNVPVRVQPLWGNQLKSVVNTRITTVVTKTKQLLECKQRGLARRFPS